MLTVQLKNCENAAGACESVGNVKEAVKHLCVHSEKKRREIIQKENNNNEKEEWLWCVFSWGRGGGQSRGLSFPLAPPWPQPEAYGGPRVPEEKHLGLHHP